MSHLLDGQSRKATIPPAGGADAFTIQYRPALWSERDEYYELTGEARGAQRVATKIKFITSHLVAWTVADPVKDDGSTVAVSADAVKRLEPVQLDAILSKLLGYGTKEEGDDVKN